MDEIESLPHLQKDFRRSSPQGSLSAARLDSTIEAVEHRRTTEKKLKNLKEQANKVTKEMDRFLTPSDDEKPAKQPTDSLKQWVFLTRKTSDGCSKKGTLSKKGLSIRRWEH